MTLLRAARATGAGLVALLAFCLGVAAPAAAASSAAADRVAADLEDAIVALQSEVLVLVQLDAFAVVPPRLRTVHDEYASYLDGLDTAGLQHWLEDADRQGADALLHLREDGLALTDPIVRALSPLPRATMDAFLAGSAVTLPGQEWAAALGDLEGLAASSSDPGILSPQPAAATTRPDPPTNPPPAPKVQEGASPGLVTAALLVGGAALAVAVSVAAVVLRRRRRAVTTEADTDSALAAGRRLAEATDHDRLRAVVLAEVCALTGADDAAWLCDADGGDTADTAPTPAPLSDEAVAILDQVADTAQSRTAIAAWRSGQPEHALLAVAVTGRGRVWGALVARRDADRPFEAAERVRLERLAPMVATVHGTVERHHTLAELSLTDGLTALANRRRLDRDLATTTSGSSVGFVMIDVDHFKNYNDTHGHPAGDELLRRLAAVLTSCVRREDVVYRYGGEEFAVLMPGADLASAQDAAERIRATIASADLPGASSQPGGRVTVSVGVAVGPGDDAAALHLAADDSLYEAKRLGRNRVVTAGDDRQRSAADA